LGCAFTDAVHGLVDHSTLFGPDPLPSSDSSSITTKSPTDIILSSAQDGLEIKPTLGEESLLTANELPPQRELRADYLGPADRPVEARSRDTHRNANEIFGLSTSTFQILLRELIEQYVARQGDFPSVIAQLQRFRRHFYGVSQLAVSPQYHRGLFGNGKLYVEHSTQQKWDWWPCAPVRPPLGQTETQVTWVCVS